MTRDHAHRSMSAGHLPDVHARGDAPSVRIDNIFRAITSAVRVGDKVKVTVSDALGTREVTFGLLDRITFMPY